MGKRRGENCGGGVGEAFVEERRKARVASKFSKGGKIQTFKVYFGPCFLMRATKL